VLVWFRGRCTGIWSGWGVGARRLESLSVEGLFVSAQEARLGDRRMPGVKGFG